MSADQWTARASALDIFSTMRRGLIALIAILGVASLVGCGAGDAPVAAATTSDDPALPRCALMEPGVNDRFMLCRGSNPGDRGSFSFRGRGPIPISYPGKGPAGHWSAASSRLAVTRFCCNGRLNARCRLHSLFLRGEGRPIWLRASADSPMLDRRSRMAGRGTARQSSRSSPPAAARTRRATKFG